MKGKSADLFIAKRLCFVHVSCCILSHVQEKDPSVNLQLHGSRASGIIQKGPFGVAFKGQNDLYSLSA